MSYRRSPISASLKTLLCAVLLLDTYVDAAFSSSMRQPLRRSSLFASRKYAARNRFLRQSSHQSASMFPRPPLHSRHVSVLSLVPGELDDLHSKGRHSYVEGEHFDVRSAEIEAMGGDPFFLTDDESTENSDEEEIEDQPPSLSSFDAMEGGILGSLGIDSLAMSQWSTTNGMGPKPTEAQLVAVEEWDGWEVEDAHFDG